jgi:hypothetical protein
MAELGPNGAGARLLASLEQLHVELAVLLAVRARLLEVLAQGLDLAVEAIEFVAGALELGHALLVRDFAPTSRGCSPTTPRRSRGPPHHRVERLPSISITRDEGSATVGARVVAP